MRYFWTSAVALVVSGILAVYWWRSPKAAVRSLKFDSEVVVDLGIQRVGTNDFNAGTTVRVRNDSGTCLYIRGIQKACVCETFYLSAQELLPGADLIATYAHNSVTGGRGGFFSDVMIVDLWDGQRAGKCRFRFCGFVIRSSHVIPETIEFLGVDPQSSQADNAKFVYLFLCRLDTAAGKLVLLPETRIKTVKAPPGIEVELVDARSPKGEIARLTAIAPQMWLPRAEIASRAGTKTEERVRQFLKDGHSDADIWQTLGLIVRPRPGASSVDDTIVLTTDYGEVRLPVKVSISADVVAYPASVGMFFSDGRSEAIVNISSPTGKPLALRSVESNNPSIKAAFSCDPDGVWQVRVTAELLHTSGKGTLTGVLSVQTNVGSLKIPVRVLASGVVIRND